MTEVNPTGGPQNTEGLHETGKTEPFENPTEWKTVQEYGDTTAPKMNTHINRAVFAITDVTSAMPPVSKEAPEGAEKINFNDLRK